MGIGGEVRLWDSQWVAVVNDQRVLNASDAEEAVAIAVRLTEEALAGNVARNHLPPPRNPGQFNKGEA